jgi:hypothetical protein
VAEVLQQGTDHPGCLMITGNRAFQHVIKNLDNLPVKSKFVRAINILKNSILGHGIGGLCAKV